MRWVGTFAVAGRFVKKVLKPGFLAVQREAIELSDLREPPLREPLLREPPLWVAVLAIAVAVAGPLFLLGLSHLT
jgi:hypothetical protein